MGVDDYHVSAVCDPPGAWETELPRARPFSNGADFCWWEARNCLRCAKHIPETTAGCEIDEALTVAYWDDGTIHGGLARRMGCDEDGRAPVRCREWEGE